MTRKAITLALILAVVPTVLFGQPATGLPPFASFSGGPFDTVNNGNLNVHFEIPVINDAGRGLPFTYTLTYDSSVWYPVTSGSNTVWTPVSNWGWKAVTAAATGYVSWAASNTNCTCFNCSTYNWTVYTNWQYHDALGAVHPFSGAAISSWGPAWPCGGGPPPSETNIVADDGSGYQISTSVVQGSYQQTPGFTLKAKNGTIINAPGQVGTGSGSLTDRNGNYISVTSGTQTTFTDTLGTTALTAFGGGASPEVLAYPNPGGTTRCTQAGAPAGTSCYVVNYSPYTVQTSFGCSGITDYPATSGTYLVSSIALPDGTSYTVQYETLANNNVTGRIKSITLPTGGTITYAYSGGSGGITCSDGTAATLSRTTPDSASVWKYVHTESGTNWGTTITDPSTNVTVMTFESVTYAGFTNGYETQRKVNQGASTLLQTVDTCYNNAALPCTTTPITSFPPTQVTTRTTPANYTLQDWRTTIYNTYGLPQTVYEYDYGHGGIGTLLRQTNTLYASPGNNIVDMPSSVSTYNGSGALVAQTNYFYDQTALQPTSGTPHLTNPGTSRGNATTVQYLTTAPSTYLTQTYSYYDTGNVYQFNDVNSGQTTYTYGSSTSCGNSFPTGVTEAVTTLSRSYAWNCTGRVMTSVTDENTQVWSTGYADPDYWRPTSTTDPASATTNLHYYTGPFASESSLNFNGTTSTVDTRTTLDGLGRTYWTQRKQTQTSTNYDSVQTTYDALGRPYKTTVPFSAPAATSSSNNTTAPFTQTTYDALGRPTLVTDGGGGTTAYNYTQTPGASQVGFDVLVTISGPTGTQTFKRQMEYDGLGRLTSVCELTSASGIGAGNCAQSVAATGFWTKYTYDVLNDLLTVTQNAQGTTTQSRTYAYDGMGRMTSEKNPETTSLAYTYTFDTDATCGTHNGDLVKRGDPQGTVTCYAYDPLHRLTAVTYSGGYASVTPSKTYVYDAATVNGSAMQNAKGHLAEAYTGSSKTTDLGFSYTRRGEVSDVYQNSPHSGAYYHMAATYWAAQGLLDTLNPNMTGIPTWTYTPEGEGRVNTVSASSGSNPVTATSYNGFSEPTAITLGSSDADAFQYDANTGRMTQYKATINNQAVSGTLTWNANWTLKTLATVDPFNSGNNAKTCSYAYDDLARLSQADCGSGNWGQNFSYLDTASGTAAFGNISKSVIAGHTGQSFTATYSDTTNRLTTSGVTYDNNGNATYDGFHHYTWDGEGKLVTLDGSGNAEVYDALGRRVEQYVGGAFAEIVYGPAGNKLALMNGQTVTKVFAPLSGGAAAVYTSAGLSYYRHPDWLGSSRVASTPTRGIYYDGAYAPYGEAYVETGTTDRNFAGQNQDLTPGSTGDMYDFLYRQYHSTQGRWISPDPAGMNAVDPENPQTLNRYAYVAGNTTAATDPDGLDFEICDIWIDPWSCGGIPFPLPPILIIGGGGSIHPPGGSTGKAGSNTTIPSTSNGTYSGVDGFPNGETLGLPSGMTIPTLSLPGMLGLPGAGGCDVGPCVGVPPNGYAAAAAIVLGGACIGSGVCEVVATVGAAVTAGIIVFKVADTIYMSQHGTGNVADTGVLDMAQKLVNAGKAGDICAALAQLLDAARAAGNTQQIRKIVSTQKAKGCRGSRQSR